MKKLLLTAILSLSVVASVQANTYSDNNPANVWLNIVNPSYTGEFTLAGYNPTTETITSANATFTFWDGLFSESFDVNMSGDLIAGHSFSGWLNLSSSVVNALVTLDTTGALSYTVTRTSGEFWLKNASLCAEATTRNVPDSSATALLLGLGVVGFVAAKRRFGSAA